MSMTQTVLKLSPERPQSWGLKIIIICDLKKKKKKKYKNCITQVFVGYEEHRSLVFGILCMYWNITPKC